jgi:hypothetical protein
MMKKNIKGQAAFIGLIMLVVALIIFFLALPFLNEFIQVTADNSGGATAFVVRAFPWVILIFLVFGGLKLLIFGGGD